MKKLLLSLFFIITPLYAVTDILQNKQYPLPTYEKSSAVPAFTGVGSFIAGMECIGDPLEKKIVTKFTVKHPRAILSIAALKMALVSVVAYGAYDWAATFTYCHVWPLQAAAALKIMVNEFAVLQSIWHHTMTTSLINPGWNRGMHSLIKEYSRFLHVALEQLNDVSFDVCDEKTLELITALQADLEGLESLEILIPFNHEALCEAACDDRPLCEQLAELKSKLPMGHYINRLGFGVNEACHAAFMTQKESFTQAIKHCNRLATLQNGWDMTQGLAEYLKWVVTEWTHREKN